MDSKRHPILRILDKKVQEWGASIENYSIVRVPLEEVRQLVLMELIKTSQCDAKGEQIDTKN